MNAFLTSIGYQHWVLPALLVIPLVGAALIWAVSAHAAPGEDEVASGAARMPRALALLTFAVEFIVSLGLWWSFLPAVDSWQSLVDAAWIPSWGVRFTIGVDGIAVMMILLTTFIMLLAVGGSWTSIRTRTRGYYSLLLVLTTGMLGVFVALDLFLFYVMWEVMLVPMYFIIGIWGGERRIYASLKFFLYTMIGSMLMLAAIVYLGLAARSPVTGLPNFSYDYIIQNVGIGSTTAKWLFGAFFLAFAVKVPMFPFHTWLPDAHVEAPTAGSVILAGVMLKMGTYGFIRFCLPLFPEQAHQASFVFIALAIVGIIYGSMVAAVQPDAKKLVAY
ncbi:MAG TPA: NADH-quinone oxidoreductase subunit M, partial [Gemmatimonadaceae bacterium]|nr:NADH-quinone oxidoreductase subunit M [Gemmatimonadaceae bacterium]